MRKQGRLGRIIGISLCLLLLAMALSIANFHSASALLPWHRMASPTSERLWSVWGEGENDVFAVGDRGTILHFDGTSWSTMDSGVGNNLYGVWGSSSSAVYAVGDSGIILSYRGSIWTAMRSPPISSNLVGVWGTSSTNIFAVGYDGTILHYNGDMWEPMDSGTVSELLGIWGDSPSNVFVVGNSGTILHYDGASWSPMNGGTGQALNSVWGISGYDAAYAVGDSGTIIQYDSGIWGPMTGGGSGDLFSVWGSYFNDIFAVGVNTFYYDGATWFQMTTGQDQNLYGVWGSSGSDVFAVGDNGNILHYGVQRGVPTSSGTVGFGVNTGTISSLTSVSVDSITTTRDKPTNVDFPYGLFSFNIGPVAPGGSVVVTMNFPSPVPVGTRWWKVGPTADDPIPHWYSIPIGSDDGDNVITITLTDGGQGDDNYISPDGVITDPGGPAFPQLPSVGAVPIFPSLYIGIVAALAAGVLAYFVRRRLLAHS